jgi:dimethylargininase
VLSTPVNRRILAAVVSGAVTALVAHLVTVFGFFVGSQFASAAIGAANGFFGFGTLLTFVLLAVGGYFTAFRRLWQTLLVALVAAVVGAFLGVALGAVLSGTSLGADAIGGIAGTFAGVNLLFTLAVVLTAAALARRIYRAIAEARPSVLRSGKVALVRLAAPNLADGRVLGERLPVDLALADEQWAAYVDAFREGGWEVVEVPAADRLADSVFVEDTAVMLGATAVLARPGAEERREEVADVEDTLRGYGFTLARIVAPGTLDGGDVLTIGHTVYVGRSQRTNADAVRQLREIARPLGYTVVAVPVTKVLHLKSAVTALPDGTVIGHPTTVDDPRIFPSYFEVPEPEGVHVVALDEDTVLLSAGAPRTAELLQSLGYRTVVVDISEFEKLDGCVTCLSIRLR